jgi:bZIP-type transcription factor MBZ1
MPARFFQSHGQGLSALLSGKNVASSVTATSMTTTKSMPEPTKEQAALAALASQTLLRRLGGAFWDAFSGASSSSTSTASSKAWDVDKVRRVLEGKAVVAVVDLEGVTIKGVTKADKKCTTVLGEMLAESMGGLSLKK